MKRPKSNFRNEKYSVLDKKHTEWDKQPIIHHDEVEFMPGVQGDVSVFI